MLYSPIKEYLYRAVVLKDANPYCIEDIILTTVIFTRTAITTVLLLGFGQAALAQPYSKIIAFGDSLTDTGQYPDIGSPLVNINGNPTPTAGLRITNRVGPTYLPTELTGEIAIQHVARGLGLDNLNPSSPILPGILTSDFTGTNYAVAGNQTAAILASITDTGGATVTAGSSSNVQNGYLVDHPRADPNALYYINGGGNDIIFGTITDAAGAINSAHNIALGFNALHSAGARYIMVSNLPHIGSTPLGFAAGQANPAIQSGMTLLSGALNQALYQEINQSDANIVTLDVAGLLEHVRANPAQYGFSAIDTCFDNSRAGSICASDPNFGLSSGTPNPNQLLFNDDVHPTTKAQALFGDYTLNVLAAPADIAILPSLGLQMVNSDLHNLQSHMASTQNLNTFGQWQGSFSIEGSDYSSYNTVYENTYSGSGSAFHLMGQRRMNPNWRIGGAISASKGQFSSRQSASSINIENSSLSAYMSFHDGRYNSSGIIQYTMLRYADLRRHSPLGQITNRFDYADTKGAALSFDVMANYDISFEGGKWRYGPHFQITKNIIDIDAYAESPNSITALNVDKLSTNSSRINTALFAQFLSEDKTVTLTTQLGLLTEVEMPDETVGLSLQSLDVKSGQLPGYHGRSESVVAGQVNLTYAPTGLSRISLIYHSVSGDDENQSLAVALTYHF